MKMLNERLSDIIDKLIVLEENFLEADENSSEEETIAYKLNDIEKYIEKIEDELNK